MKTFWKRLGRDILDVVFPGNCPICEGPPYRDEVSYSCLGCLDQLAWVRGARCKKCGAQMYGIDYLGLTCSSCREQNHSFQSGRCMFTLDQRGTKIIHEIKYHGVKEVLGDLKLWLERSEGFREFLEDSILVPVPLHWRRRRKRGFNQSLWIARGLAKELGSKVEVMDCMKRVRNTPTQTTMEKKARKKNVKNAFALTPGLCLDSNHRIVLIDDVFTTGATLDACAQAWSESGVKKVDIATLGRG
ncbi:MAG: hypothetical protein CMI27_05345 [Opitutae bacterium]|nr:hypothetical protein [Opitutae bacterium]